MKKFLIVLAIILVLALLAAGISWAAWLGAGEDTMPEVTVTVQGQALHPRHSQWHTSFLGGLFHREHVKDTGEAPTFVGTLEEPLLNFTLPPAYENQLTLWRNGEELFQGSAEGWDNALLEQDGSYGLEILLWIPQESGQNYGRFTFDAEFEVAIPQPVVTPDPELITGNIELEQGDVFTLRVLYLPEDVTPTAETELGLSVFVRQAEETGGWLATIPIGNNRTPGEYPVSIRAGELAWDTTVTVLAFPYDEQNLIIDDTTPEITEANSSEAYQQYREKIPPLFPTYDETTYWQGQFVYPVDPALGRISTNFGARRYTNGDRSTMRSHNGMDIAVAEGTPVYAPNNGRVVLAEYLLNTGNTVVIEHGGGLKTYYFHMVELTTEPDAIVQQGDQIGAVGTTGYSTGPHLHFEVRIGDQPISPQILVEAGAGIYSAPAPEAETTE